MNQRRKIAVLGSTGSIGRQTLDIAAEYPQLFEVDLLVANRSAELLIEQALRFKPRNVVIASRECFQQVAQALEGTGISVHTGDSVVSELVALPEVDTVVTAMVGYSGLASTIAAIKAGKKIALANKETLVVAGELINEMLKDSPSVLYPVDSEHGAFYQCLVGEDINNVSRLILTASGGPFRTFPREKLATVTKDDALRHPNWAMGAKITIDSATMMNKGFEMIEAKWLYGISQENIDIVVHPQSIVHSMVEFVDGSVKAQLGLPDMHLPIRYALGLPGRLATNEPRMTVADYANLTFEKPDFEKFPLLGTAYEAARRGGNVPCVMNAANEIAVAAFLADKIGFNDIYNTIEKTMAWAPFIDSPDYDDYVQSNVESRSYAKSLISSF
ncbi:MAG: 1-deoxy-D-xylulose-5-phosphate reductoisomerase [Muribaculaceae bacterium]|nr:1-deoxy-D-xylulose-5-phosphate reductoisomerase [Muribaculaceae bacterium]